MNTVQQNLVNVLRPVITEHEEDLRQIDIDTTEILVLEPGVCRRINDMNQNPNDLLAVFRLADLVQLVDIDNRVHALALHQYVHNAAPGRIAVSIIVPLQRRRIARPTECDDVKRPGHPVFVLQTLAQTKVGQRCLANAGLALEAKRIATLFLVGGREPLSDDLHDFSFCLAVAIHGCIQYILDLFEIGPHSLNMVR